MTTASGSYVRPRMSYGSGQEKRPEVVVICKLPVTRWNRSEWDQCAKPTDPQIILRTQVMRARLEFNLVMT